MRLIGGLLLGLMMISAPIIHAADEWEELFSDLNEGKSSAQGKDQTQSDPVQVNSSADAQNSQNAVIPVAAATDFPEPTQQKSDNEKNAVLKEIEEEMARSATAVETKTSVRPELGISAVLDSAASKKPAVASGAMPSFDSSRDKIESLERRISDLERENRLMTERVRNLTRSVDDIKRKI